MARSAACTSAGASVPGKIRNERSAEARDARPGRSLRTVRAHGTSTILSGITGDRRQQPFMAKKTRMKRARPQPMTSFTGPQEACKMARSLHNALGVVPVIDQVGPALWRLTLANE